MAEPGLSRDSFLGGRVSAWQARDGFRSGEDAVLMAAAVPAGEGQRVLDLGAGAGVASLCLAARVPGLRIEAVERDPETAALALRNAADAGAGIGVTVADLSALPEPLKGSGFDHVMMNPPWFGPGTPAANGARAAARHEETPLAAWIATGLKRLSPGGQLTLIHRSDRLPEILGLLFPRAGDIRVVPIVGRVGKPAGRVVLIARKGAKGPFSLSFPLVMHDGHHHRADEDSHSPAAQAILRDGASLQSVIDR